MGRGYDIRVVKDLPHYYSFDECKIGAFAITSGYTKYCEVQNALFYNNRLDTIGGHYRTIISDRKIRFPKKNPPPDNVTYPYKANAVQLPYGVYIDLRSAFQKIACVYGYETWFQEGQALQYGVSIPDEQLFNDCKTARGLLVTAHGKQGRFTQWRNHELTTVHFSNEHYAPFLRYAIWRTLHLIMGKIAPFCHYVHTDGAIVNINLLYRVEKILDGMHLEYAVKLSGNTHIKGVGCFRIGEAETANFNNRHLNKSRQNIITDEYDGWWMRRFMDGMGMRGNLS